MAQFPSDATAYGIWSLREQRDAVRGDNWPIVTLIEADILVVGGGGGGSGGLSGVHFGGGGAAGVARINTFPPSTGATYTVTVGAGGAPTITGGGIDGNNGTNSSIVGTGLSVIATAGNGNPHDNVNGADNADHTGGVGTGSFPNGGGAGAAGNGNDIDGGAAFISSIRGSSASYGGGGAGKNSAGDGTPGTGGGTSLVAATVNTGSGGGGTSASFGGTAGGSGVVIIRTEKTAASTTGSPTVTTDGNFNIYTFTGSGSITF